MYMLFMLKRRLIKLCLRVELLRHRDCKRPAREAWLCGCGNNESDRGLALTTSLATQWRMTRSQPITSVDGVSRRIYRTRGYICRGPPALLAPSRAGQRELGGRIPPTPRIRSESRPAYRSMFHMPPASLHSDRF